MIYAVMQLIGGMIMAVAWIPQIVQILRTKSVKDLNNKTFLFLVTGIALMEVYAVHMAWGGVGYAFLITNSVSLLIMLMILGCILRFRS
ncbi:PQ-loop domain-containing transporter [Paenibacillus sp. SAF-054]|uniref:PQ-loop domain-containing transporter n=1 Tax=unclassified Paenibacillus TaxID=185978 RepID=UPI003F805AFA